jgi:hypothetical protein
MVDIPHYFLCFATELDLFLAAAFLTVVAPTSITIPASNNRSGSL